MNKIIYSLNQEFLYDFNLIVGDTVSFYEYSPIVIKIDSVKLLNNKFRK
jgi:hypothetical protein